jgi:hypothetical protein
LVLLDIAVIEGRDSYILVVRMRHLGEEDGGDGLIVSYGDRQIVGAVPDHGLRIEDILEVVQVVCRGCVDEFEGQCPHRGMYRGFAH